MKPLILLALLPALTAPPISAAVYRCVGADGSITFSDTDCRRDGSREEVKIHAAPKPPPAAAATGISKGVIDARFREAQAKCEEGLLPFLKSRRPNLPKEAKGAVVRVIGRHVTKALTEVRYMAEVTYLTEPSTNRTEVECTATREGSTPWAVDYFEGATHSYIQFQ